jgi:hypothetical protein
MLDWRLLVYYGLIDGRVLPLVLTILSVIARAIALDMFVGDYPLEIRDKYGPMSRRAARLRRDGENCVNRRGGITPPSLGNLHNSR